jgi:hypothetical protein
MSGKYLLTINNKVITATNVRLALFVLTLVLFLIGAGAPSDGGGLGGY